jgi:hypothetical protein
MHTLFKSQQARNLSRNIQVKEKWSSEDAWCHDPAMGRLRRKSLSVHELTKQCRQKEIQFSPSPPLIRRDSYSTITTIDEVNSPQNSTLCNEPSTSFNDKSYIPKIIYFSSQEEKDEIPHDMPLIRKAKFVPDPMNVGAFYADDVSVTSNSPGWPKLEGQASIKTRKSPRQLLDEMDTPHRKKGSCRPVLRRGVSRGLDSLVPPIRVIESPPFATSTRLEI